MNFSSQLEMLLMAILGSTFSLPLDVSQFDDYPAATIVFTFFIAFPIVFAFPAVASNSFPLRTGVDGCPFQGFLAAASTSFDDTS